MKSRGKGQAHNHYRFVFGIRVGTIATDTFTLSQVTIKNEAAQTLFGCSQQSTIEKSVDAVAVNELHKQVIHTTLISSMSSRPATPIPVSKSKDVLELLDGVD